MTARFHGAGTVLFVAVVVLAGVGGAVAATTAASGHQDGGAGTNPGCAATPPDDSSDPDGDVLGWEAGYWYDESLAVIQDDGLDDSELDAIIARTMARVEFVRCVEFERTVPVEIIDRETFRQRELERDVAPELRTFDNAKFEALFLVGESEDSIAVQNRNRATGILGFYDPRNDSIVVVSENRSTLRMDEITLAHELLHAHQDRRYDLTADPFDVRIRDRANAIDGLVEGDAHYTDDLYERRCTSGDWSGTCLREGQPPGGSLANVGVYFVKFQPVSDGPAFVRLARTIGGWDAVDALYERPPASSEQTIHVEKFRSDEPTAVNLRDRNTDAWTRVRPPDRPDFATFGEAAIASMFAFPTYDSRGQTQIVTAEQWLNTNESGNVSSFDPIDYDTEFSSGWDGDRLHVYRNAENETAYVWRLAWDSPADAREFVRGYRRVLSFRGAEQVGPDTYRIAEGGFADAFYVTVEGTTVTIVNAPGVEDLLTVRQGIDANATNATRGQPSSTFPNVFVSFPNENSFFGNGYHVMKNLKCVQ